MLPVRRLGPLTVSAIGFGCMNLSHAYDTKPSQADAIRLLHRALDAGCTMLDTAALYGGGDNEQLVGAAMSRRRPDYTLATKCVLEVVDGKRTLDGSPERIRASCDESLRRLNTDVIDLFYLHRLDPAVPIEASMGAAADLVRQGKIRAIGLSEMSAAIVMRAHAVHPVAAVQSEYSLAVRNPEVAVLDTCRRLGIGFVAFSPLCRGLLAGSVLNDNYRPGDIRSGMPRFNGARLQHNLSVVARLHALADAAGCTIGQLALAWLLAREHQVVPIPGTRSAAHLDENVGACKMSIPPALLAEAGNLLAPGTLRGARYNAATQGQIDTEFLPNEELAG